MDANKPILILHDGDRIARAIARQLGAARRPVRELGEPLPADEIVSAAFGCRAIIAVGDRLATDPAVRSAANMPGVRALVLIVNEATDFTELRRRGVPYTVLRFAPLLEDVVAALDPVIATGRLLLDADSDVSLTFIAAEDAAACAIAAVDHDDYCGRVVELSAPCQMKLSAAASAMAKARQRSLKVSMSPRWMIVAMRALGRVPFRLSEAFMRRLATEDPSALHPGPWRSIEQVATAPVERSDRHAMGMR